MGQAWTAAHDEFPFQDVHLLTAKSWLKSNEAPRQAFPMLDLFNNPAWNVMLDLYIALLEHRAICVSSACIASGAASTTALRYLSALADAGLLVRIPDKHDRRKTYVELSTQGKFGVECAITSALKADNKLGFYRSLVGKGVEGGFQMAQHGQPL